MFTATYPVEILNEIHFEISAVRASHESHKKILLGFFSPPLNLSSGGAPHST